MYSHIVATCLALLPLATAQTTTKCNPLTNSCPANPGLSADTYSVDFTGAANGNWAGSTAVSYGDQGVALPVAGASDSPSLYSDFYILFGYVEARIKAAPGVGIVSSLVLLSDDLDEIDWEWLGASPSTVQSNYFGKGNTTTYDREQTINVAGATTTFHTYAIDWTSSSITWLIDGNPVRTLNYADAVGGKNYPQTPCRIGFGAWPAGASPNEGTREWAGGVPDFSQGPFVMYTQNINIVNYNPAQGYQYGDQSGSYQSIQVIGGNSASVVGSGSGSGSGSSSNANPSSAAVSPASSSSAAAPPPSGIAPTPAPTSPTTAPTLPDPSSPASSHINPSPSSISESPATAPPGTNSDQNTQPSSTTADPSSSASPAPGTDTSSVASNSTTSTSDTSSSTTSTTLRSSTTNSNPSTTSSASDSTSPSTAPNAAASIFRTDFIATTLVSMLALTFGMLML